MNAKAQPIEVIPTALDELRDALATRDALGKRASEIAEKINRLAPIEAAVAYAQNNMEKVLDAEQQKLRAWADKGAEGAPPEVDAAARENASRQLADARAQLAAAGAVKEDLTNAWMAVNAQVHQHQGVVATAEINVLGEEAMRAVEDMRKTALAVLESEAAFMAVRFRMQAIADQVGRDANGHTARASRSFSDWVGAIHKANRINSEERQQAVRGARGRMLARIEKLQAGEDPDA